MAEALLDKAHLDATNALLNLATKAGGLKIGDCSLALLTKIEKGAAWTVEDHSLLANCFDLAIRDRADGGLVASQSSIQILTKLKAHLPDPKADPKAATKEAPKEAPKPAKPAKG